MRPRGRPILVRIKKRKSALALLLLAAILVPNLTYNLWPQEVPYGWVSSRFLNGTFDLSKQALPPVYREVRQWLNTKITTGDIFRLFWLPIDPAVISSLEFTYPETPVFFPRFDERNYTQTIFDYLSNAHTLGWYDGLGHMLARANVKYVIVNLSANDGGGIWKQQGPISLTPWGPSWDLKYYFTGDPVAYKELLDQEQGLKTVLQGDDFVVYENLDFVPYFTAYRSAYMVLPTKALDQRVPDFSVYNYSNNLVQNGGFEDQAHAWGLQGNWTLTSYPHSGNYSLLGNNSGDGWIVARQDVSLLPNVNYYMSAWMRTQNVKQSHLRLTFYDSRNNPILNTYPQSGIDGSHDWLHVREAGVSPQNTSYVSILLMGGWSLDKQNPGLTWFDDVSVFRGYYPNPSPTHFWAYSIMVASSEGHLLSDIPTLGGGSLIISGEIISPSTFNDHSITELSQTVNGLVLFGDARRNSTLLPLIDSFPRLLFAYEPESVLQPETGTWLHLRAPSIGTPEGVAVTGSGQGTQNFFVPRDSNYTVAIRATTNGTIGLRIDNETINSEGYHDSSGRTTAWIQSATTGLRHGQHRLSIVTDGNSTILEKIVMLSSTSGRFRLEDIAPGSKPSITFTENTSTEYDLQLNCQGRAYVLFGQTYDSSWSAIQNGAHLGHWAIPFHMYWSNLFTSVNSGPTSVEVLFGQQESRNTLIVFWEIGWLVSLAYIGLGYRGRLVKLFEKLKSLRKH